MKKLILVAALLSSSVCHALTQSSQYETFQDTGVEEALVCSNKLNARQYVKLAGDNDTEAFKKFAKQVLAKGDCRFLGNREPIRITGHEHINTQNGPLFVVRFTQDGAVWWSSANYFPVTYPLTNIWEDQLHEPELPGQIGEPE